MRSAMDVPRNFLYDDYMDSDLHGERSSTDMYGTTRLTNTFRGRANARNHVDMAIDSYVPRGRATTTGRRRFAPLDDLDDALPETVGRPRALNNNSSRMAAALGIPARRQVVYEDDLVYQPRPKPVRRVVRRVVQDYDEPVEEIVEVIRPKRPIRVVKKVPIQQRVRKIIVTKPGPSNFKSRTTSRPAQRSNDSKRNNSSAIRRKPGAGIQKRTPKPKISHNALDQELDEYMRSSKHPRINV